MTPRPIALLATALLALASAAPARAQQIVYDPTSYAKLIEQARTSLQQLQQLKSQLTQAERLYDAFNTGSGVNKLATILSVPALRAVLPDAAAFGQAGEGDLAALGQIGRLATEIRAKSRLFTPQDNDAIGQALARTGDRAARDLALGETVAGAGAERLTGLQQLQDALDGAGDARAVLDLQARLAAEQAMTANDQMRLQGLTMAQTAEERLQDQQSRERAAAARAARMATYRQAFQ
jgi:type IV secretion system protein VirB5